MGLLSQSWFRAGATEPGFHLLGPIRQVEEGAGLKDSPRSKLESIGDTLDRDGVGTLTNTAEIYKP